MISVTPVVSMSPEQDKDTKFKSISIWIAATTCGKDYTFSTSELLEVCSQFEISAELLYSFISDYCSINNIDLIIGEDEEALGNE